MLDMSWNSALAKDPLILADAIELLVAFAEDDYSGRFTRANFQHFVAMENLADDETTYIAGDEADEYISQFEDALTLIKKRGEWLGAAYPFRVVSDEVAFTPLSGAGDHLPYLFLLVCSNGNSVPLLKKALPGHFENLCKEAFKSLFPEWAMVLLFSKDSEDRKNIFGSAASSAVPKLAELLNTDVMNAGQLGSTQREYGIDLMAICQFGDEATYPFFAFAQCTIERDWSPKRTEAIAENELTAFVTLNARHTNFLMIPHFPRYNLEEWSQDPSRTGNCILCDRFRICRLLQKSSFFEPNNPPAGIDNVFNILEGSLAEAP